MNHHRSPGLSAVGRASIVASVRSRLNDPNIARTIQVSTPTTVTRVSGTLTQDLTYQTDQLSAVFEPLSLREVETSGGRYQMGDQVVRVLADDLSTPPTTDSTLIIDGETYAVVMPQLDPLSIHWRLIARRSP
ncbi:MAG: hypothetical protein AAFV53_31770 [Myxococcota bacterium]